MGFRLVTKSVTLNELERRNDRRRALSLRCWDMCRMQIMGADHCMTELHRQCVTNAISSALAAAAAYRAVYSVCIYQAECRSGRSQSLRRFYTGRSWQCTERAL